MVSSIWPWRSRSIVPQNNRDFSQGLYISGPYLVILAWTGDELSRGQARDHRTHGRMDTQTQATTIPEGQNWPRVKTTVGSGKLHNQSANIKTKSILDEYGFYYVSLLDYSEQWRTCGYISIV